ncbi:MAG: START-like domain-containing protein [Flavobacteriales bacterium]
MKKEKYEIEFMIQASPSMLYSHISTPDGLSEWFADNVNSRGEDFEFVWDNMGENAKLLKTKQDKYVRFQWEDDEDTDYYFNIEILVDDLTKDVSLIITDFTEEDEIDEAKMFWENKIAELKQTIGA